ncbi:hypothetical protein AB0P10_28755 [Streptomyces parvus]|uniref:hypothetical protein n=1 Tax=Streptomyces parvus TaxID=66428 RepID=UPI003428E63A
MSVVPPDVAAFITMASQMPGRTLDAIRWATASAVGAGFYDTSMVPALSAPQFSALNKQVRDAFAPRAEELRAGRPGGLRSAISCTTRTAQLIWKRDRLAADQYASLTAAFTAHGFAPPDHIPQHLRRQLITDENRLIAVGSALFATLADDPALSVVELPDGLGVCLVHTARGGGKLYVAPDETALFVGSSVDFGSGLEAFRDGARTPLETFDIDPGRTDA